MNLPRTRRLGSGIDALLGPKPTTGSDSAASGVTEIELERLRPSPYQPRTDFDEEAIKQLAASIRKQGLVQPIVVRRVGNHFELVVGERRLRAARLAKLKTLPALVREFSDNDAAAVTLIENIQREDLNPIEEATALQRLSKQLNYTHEQIADLVGRARATVTNLIRLLELHSDVQEWVREGHLSMGHVRMLITLPKPRQRELAKMIRDRGLSVREAERLKVQKKSTTSRSKPQLDPDLLHLQQRLSDQLGYTAAIRPKRRGKGGELVLRYASDESLQGLLEQLGYKDE